MLKMGQIYFASVSRLQINEPVLRFVYGAFFYFLTEISIAGLPSPNPAVVNGCEAIINSAIKSSYSGSLVKLSRELPNKIAILSDKERSPLSAEVYNEFLKGNTEDSPPLKRLALRFASESGKMDGQSVVRLLDEFNAKDSESKAEYIDAAVYAFEAGAIFSPLTFIDLVNIFGKEHPDLLASVLAKATIPTGVLSEVIARASTKTKNEIASSLSDKVLNGTPDEIRAALALFPNPATIPRDSRSRLLIAAALLGSEAVDKWLGVADAKTRVKIFDELYSYYTIATVHVAGIEAPSIHAWGVRAQRLLESQFSLTDSPQKTISLLISRCDHAESIATLDNFAKRYKALNLKNPDNRRSVALSKSILLQSEANDSISNVMTSIENGVDSKDADLIRASVSVLAYKDRERAKTYMAASSNDIAKKAIEEALMSRTDPDQSDQDRFSELEIRLSALKSDKEISAALKQRINYLIESEARYDHPKAIPFLMNLPDGATKEHAVGDFVKKWVANDPVLASDWIATLPSSRIRDTAVSELVQASQDDPEMAFQNSAAIKDKDIRRKAANSVLERWKPLNPEAIATLIDASPLTIEDKAFLAEKLTQKEPKGAKK